ncbi:hypothetical protein ElyMa_000359200 [Elysia marginata]|uniref:Nuclease HARBI1 n=1 Tax=Elysia marginata TaxID=1093978 RepID=A0AAV4FH28_9GAST|nr:hypothetical protein ElyMa_000359200 [Elysia marginata]
MDTDLGSALSADSGGCPLSPLVLIKENCMNSPPSPEPANAARGRRSFQLEAFSDQECKDNFRFLKEDIPRLAQALHLPEFVETPNRLTISGVEALCILLRRLAYPSRLVDVGRVFGLHPADISTVTNVMLNIIYDQHYNRFTSLEQPWLDFAQLSNKVVEKGVTTAALFWLH